MMFRQIARIIVLLIGCAFLVLGAFSGLTFLSTDILVGCGVLLLIPLEWLLAGRFPQIERHRWEPAVLLGLAILPIVFLLIHARLVSRSADTSTLIDPVNSKEPIENFGKEHYHRGEVCDLNLVELETIAANERTSHLPGVKLGRYMFDTERLGTNKFRVVGALAESPNDLVPSGCKLIGIMVNSPSEGPILKVFPVMFKDTAKLDAKPGQFYRVTGKLVLNPDYDREMKFASHRQPFPAWLEADKVESFNLPVNTIINDFSSVPPFHPLKIKNGKAEQ